MDKGVISQAESDEKTLTFNVPAEALERAPNRMPSQCSTALTTGTTAVCRRW